MLRDTKPRRRLLCCVILLTPSPSTDDIHFKSAQIIMAHGATWDGSISWSWRTKHCLLFTHSIPAFRSVQNIIITVWWVVSGIGVCNYYYCIRLKLKWIHVFVHNFIVLKWKLRQTSALFAAQNTMNAMDSSVMFDDTAITTEAWITIVDSRLTWISAVVKLNDWEYI